MPGPIADEVVRMAGAYAVVAAAAVPVVGVAWALRRGEPVLPRWRRWPTPFTAFDVFVLFLASQVITVMWFTAFDRLGVADVLAEVPGVAADGVGAAAGGGAAHAAESRAAAERRFWTGACAQAAALPTFLLVWYAVHRVAAGRQFTPAGGARSRFAADVVAGIFTWALVTPVAFAVFFAALWVQHELGGTADEHPLKESGAGASPARVAAFLASACVFPALFEELVFRRTILPWVVGRTARPWLLMILAGLLTGLIAGFRVGPLAFAALLCGGLFLLQHTRPAAGRVAVRRAGGVYATAALFGLLHAQVWPSPIPLFVFGLGVGYVAARTRSLWPAVICHGLFNAVSVVYMLRGP